MTLATVDEIVQRLAIIFPDGTPNRNLCTTEIAAKTIFVMLYAGAIDGTDNWIRPDQITRMTDAQAALQSDEDRATWTTNSLKSSTGDITGRWYAANTRESIRDDTLRNGLIPLGAVTVRSGLPTTSPAPRYALGASFAALFTASLTGEALEKAIDDWRTAHLSRSALARVAIVRRGVVSGGDSIPVVFPNGETRSLAPGKSSIVSKAVIEEFATRFLGQPGVIWLSESGNKVVARDDDLAAAIGLSIEADKNLPDIILVDLAPEHPLLVFVEVVATDGPINDLRKTALTDLAVAGGFETENLAFLTAFEDRSRPEFKRAVDSLAWGSYAWFVSEPDRLLELHASVHPISGDDVTG
ncbi:MAG: BsuBI/PstI family type II restriction endonuclease [Pseudomonadota bacterium]